MERSNKGNEIGDGIVLAVIAVLTVGVLAYMVMLFSTTSIDMPTSSASTDNGVGHSISVDVNEELEETRAVERSEYSHGASTVSEVGEYRSDQLTRFGKWVIWILFVNFLSFCICWVLDSRSYAPIRTNRKSST